MLTREQNWSARPPSSSLPQAISRGVQKWSSLVAESMQTNTTHTHRTQHQGILSRLCGSLGQLYLVYFVLIALIPSDVVFVCGAVCSNEVPAVATSAWAVAASRALESALPAESGRRLNDPLAMSMVGGRAAAETLMARYAEVISHGMPGGPDGEKISPEKARSIIVSRTLFGQERLRGLMKKCQQLVILAVGLDNTAFMLGPKALTPGTKVFEVDFPSTIAHRESVIAGVAVAMPPGVTRVGLGVDASDHEALFSALLAAGFDPSSRTAFVVEGLTMYLSAEAVAGLLQFLSSDRLAATGSALLIDFATEVRNPLPSGSPAEAIVGAWEGAGWGRWVFGTNDPWTLLAESGWTVEDVASAPDMMYRNGDLSKADWLAFGGAVTRDKLMGSTGETLASLFTLSTKQ